MSPWFAFNIRPGESAGRLTGKGIALIIGYRLPFHGVYVAIDTVPSTFASPGEAPTRQQWSWIVPVACAAHCASAPFLVAVLPGLAGGEEWEWLFLAASGALGVSVMRRLPRASRKGTILALGAGGIALWTASLLGWTAPVAEAVTSGTGALLLASAMLMGSHSQGARQANGCGCSACDNPNDFRLRGRRGYLLGGRWKKR